MAWLKKTPSRNNTWSQTSKPKILPTRNVQSSKKKKHELAHSSTTSKSRKVPCWTALVTSGSLLGDLYTGDIRVWPAGCWVQGQVWPLCMYVCLFGITWEDNFRKTTRWKKKALQKSYSHFAIQSEDMIFKEMWHAIVISPAKMPPPFPNAADPWSFSMGCCCNSLRMTTATPLPWHFGNPGSLEGFIGCWKVVYLTVSNGGGKKRTGKPIRLYAGWKPFTNTEARKNMTYNDIHIVPFFLWGGKGATEKKKKEQTKHKIAPLFATIIR